MVIQRHTYEVEKIANLLKGDATRQLVKENLHPFAKFRRKDGRILGRWAQKIWKVFLDSYEDIERSIRYVEGNPGKEGKRRQRWHFVKPWRSVTPSPAAPR